MSEPIRILHVLQRMEAGGTQALLMNLYRNIDRNKVQFDFLVEYPDKQFYDDEITRLGGRVYYTNVRNDHKIWKFQNELKRIVKENNYKIIHVHAFTIGIFALKTAKKCGVPVRIAHSHNNETVRDKKYLLKKILQKLYPIYATDLFACSDEAGKYLFKNKKYKVLNNAIDSMKFVYNQEIREKKRIELGVSNSLVIGHVGRFHPQKNHSFLLDIFDKIKDKRANSKLILIGSGPEEQSIKEKVKRLGLESDVVLLGNRSDINEIYQAMDLFLFPSLFEGLGIVAIEAQAAGLPVLCSDMLPKDVEISDLCVKKSLSKTAEEWANDAVTLSEKIINKDTQDKIIKAGFDIRSTSMEMENFYIKKQEETYES